MVFGDKLRRMFSGPSPEEQAQATAAKYNQEAARQAAAIRGRIDRGEVAQADAEVRSMEVGTGMHSEDDRAAIREAVAQSELARDDAQDTQAAERRISDLKSALDKALRGER